MRSRTETHVEVFEREQFERIKKAKSSHRLCWEDDGSAKLDNITYHANSDGFGYGVFCARLFVIGPRGGKRRLNLGSYKTLNEARHACERHVAAGCDVSEAERW